MKKLYELMKGLQERKGPSVKNGFGTSWLGCLVDALDGNWKEVYCRGQWFCLEMEEGILRFETVTAWAPCNATFELVRKKFPSLHYYYQAEERGMAIYETNDSEGRYFSDRIFVDACTPEKLYDSAYLTELEDAFEWVEEIAGQRIKSQEDVDRLVKQWQKKNKNAYCYINEFKIVA